MAFAKITGLVESAVKEAQLATFDEFVKYLGAKIDVDDDMQSYIDEFKKTLTSKKKVTAAAKAKKDKSGDDGEKKKRAPSAYNLFIKEKMAELRAAGHKGNLMKLAVEAWKESKSSGSVETSESKEKIEEVAESKKVKIKVVEETISSDDDEEEAATGCDSEEEYD